jgi:hypothetical protein
MFVKYLRNPRCNFDALPLPDTRITHVYDGDPAVAALFASLAGGYTPAGWFSYGQHPVWTVITLCGPGVEAVSLYAKKSTAHGFVTYADHMPAEVWYGRPDVGGNYCSTAVHFAKKLYEFTPAIGVATKCRAQGGWTPPGTAGGL